MCARGCAVARRRWARARGRRDDVRAGRGRDATEVDATDGGPAHDGATEATRSRGRDGGTCRPGSPSGGPTGAVRAREDRRRTRRRGCGTDPCRRGGSLAAVDGAWRSLVAHLLWEQGVVGSNPAAPTSSLASTSWPARPGQHVLASTAVTSTGARSGSLRAARGCSSMVELQSSKLVTRVRFPSPAPIRPTAGGVGGERRAEHPGRVTGSRWRWPLPAATDDHGDRPCPRHPAPATRRPSSCCRA
jgi:hypothetical protein